MNPNDLHAPQNSDDAPSSKPDSNQDDENPTISPDPDVNAAPPTPQPVAPESSPPRQFNDFATLNQGSPNMPLSSPHPPEDGKSTGQAPIPAEWFTADAKPFVAPRRRSKKKLLLIILVILVVLGGGGAAAYFGYYMNANVLWKQSLGNTGKGYDKLVSYLQAQSSTHYKGMSENGTFNLKVAGTSYDGSLSAQSDGTHGTGSLDVGLGLARVSLQVRSIKPAGASDPDIYLQLNGIKGLGSLFGSDLGKQVDSLDGQWISVDHTFLEDIQDQFSQTSTAKKSVTPLTSDDVFSAARAVSSVDKQYVFTTDKSKSATTVTKKYGVETLNGHKVYHYQVALVKQNVKDYITALTDALQKTTFGTWLQKETGQSVKDFIHYDSLEKSANSIKSSDTFDVWADVHTRMLYKVRVKDSSNPAQNFAEMGLDYNGGTTYPLFINTQQKDGAGLDTLALTATIDSKANSLKVHLSGQAAGNTPATFSGDFSFKPSNNTVNVTAPTKTETLSQVLDKLGLSDYVNLLLSTSQSAIGSGSSGDDSLTSLTNSL